MRVLRDARGDRPEPAAIFRRGVGPHDAADVLLAVEYVVIVVRPLPAGTMLGRAFEDQRGHCHRMPASAIALSYLAGGNLGKEIDYFGITRYAF
jgi:hypothetical protein